MKHAGVILSSIFLLISATQNGLNLVIYELARPYIIDNYCINKTAPEMHCNGKCHLSKMMLSEENEPAGDQPANLPAPEFNFNPVYFLGTYQLDIADHFASGSAMCNFIQIIPLPHDAADIFHPPKA